MFGKGSICQPRPRGCSPSFFYFISSGAKIHYADLKPVTIFPNSTSRDTAELTRSVAGAKRRDNRGLQEVYGPRESPASVNRHLGSAWKERWSIVKRATDRILQRLLLSSFVEAVLFSSLVDSADRTLWDQ